MSIQLTIISPTEQEIHEIIWLEINSPAGNFVIQPGHAPMLITLTPQVPIMYCLQNGKVLSQVITGGILKITPLEARIITL